MVKFFRILGIVLIVLFSAVSIFFSTAQRDMPEHIKQMFRYTSFFEDRFYDFRMNLSLKHNNVHEDRLVLLNIDDESLNKIGRWPFSRTIWAETLTKLKNYGAKVVAFDVVFPEPERSCLAVSPDKVMADAIADFQSIEGNKVLLAYSLNNPPFADSLPESLYNYVLDTKQGSDNNLELSQLTKTTFPIDTLLTADPGLSFIGAEEDPDGIFRHYPLLANLETLYFPSLSLQAYQFYTGDKTTLEILGVEGPKLKTSKGVLSLNYKGETKIRWLGGTEKFPNLPMHKLLSEKEGNPAITKLLKDKVVFVGSTAFGAHDLRHTPVDAMMPGIFFHMNMTQMLLSSNFFVPLDKSATISWLLLFAGTLIIILLQFAKHAILDLLSVTILGLGAFFFDTYYLLPRGYEINLFFCLFTIFAVYLWNTLLNFYLANKDKKFLKEAFSNYISPELIDQMYTSGEPPKLGGDSGIRTAFFTDIQGFSSFSEKLTATKLVELLNEYLGEMTDILLREGGTLDKYEGDAIIAFFGAPMPQEDHAIRACRVACAMQSRLAQLRTKWVSEGDKWPLIVHEMRMRIGINTGEIVTGNMGSKVRMNYTMMGDSVNLAARLESSAKQYGVFNHVAKAVVDLTSETFLFRELDTVLVVGKSEPVRTYELINPLSDATEVEKRLVSLFNEALTHYKQMDFAKAKTIFESALLEEWNRFPELKGIKGNPSQIYIERCKEFIENPPPQNWDGVYTLREK